MTKKYCVSSNLVAMIALCSLALLGVACGKDEPELLETTSPPVMVGDSDVNSDLKDPWTAISNISLIPLWTGFVGESNTRGGGFVLNPERLEIRALGAQSTSEYQRLELPLSLVPSGELSSGVFPFLHGGWVLWVPQPGVLEAYRLSDGMRHAIPVAGGGFNAVVPGDDGQIFISSPGGTLSAVDLETGRGLWSRTYTRNSKILALIPLPKPSGASNVEETASGQQDIATSEQDEQTTSVEPSGQPESAQTVLVIASDSGWISLVDSHSGEELYRSLDVAGFSAVNSGWSNASWQLIRSAQSESTVFHISIADGEPELTEVRSIPNLWRRPQAVAFTSDEIIFAVNSEGFRQVLPEGESDSDSSGEIALLYAIDAQEDVVLWLRLVPDVVTELFATEDALFAISDSAVLKLSGRNMNVAESFPGMLASQLHVEDSAYHISSAGREVAVTILEGEPLSSYRLTRLPNEAMYQQFALQMDDELLDAAANSGGFGRGAYRYRIGFDSLPVEVPFTLEAAGRGSFLYESSRQVLIQIFNSGGRELVSNLDKVRLSDQLQYELGRGEYRLRISDGGGESEAKYFSLEHIPN